MKIERRRQRKRQRSINQRRKKCLVGDRLWATCFYCHHVFLSNDLTVEHLIPLCLGGTNDLGNLTLACLPCNQERGRESWRLKRQLVREARNVPIFWDLT